MVHGPFTRPPRGIREIRQVYGDIAVVGGQVVSPAGWESRNMVLVRDFPGIPLRGDGGAGRLYVHAAAELPLRAALERCVILGDGYAIRTIGCFAPRMKRSNSGELSLHAFGCAVDINAAENPQARLGTPDCRRDIPDAWVEAFESAGWTWGGHFPRPDPMHFQLASNY